jgi:opacity protein-like surface antigen
MTMTAAAWLWPLLAVQSPELDRDPVSAVEFESQPASARQAAGEDPTAYPSWSLGFGVDVWTGFGSVFNDMGGPSITAGHRLNERWGFGLRFFKTDFDFEDPADFVFGRSGTPIADASIDLFSVTAVARWHFLDPGGTFDFYVGAGLGYAVPESGDAVKLPEVDIAVEGQPGPEVQVAVGGAVRVFEQFHVTFELRLMKSFTEYDVEDRLSGEQETEEGFSGIGFAIGAEYRF